MAVERDDELVGHLVADGIASAAPFQHDDTLVPRAWAIVQDLPEAGSASAGNAAPPQTCWASG